MSLPTHVREEMREWLWVIADRIGWANLPASAKAKYYEDWTRNSEIGGVLTRYMDKGKVRVYLKDTLLKDYTRETLADDARPLRVLGITNRPDIAERFIKPHGLRLKDGRVVSWGRADDWKLIVVEEALVAGGVWLLSFGREPPVASAPVRPGVDPSEPLLQAKTSPF